MLKTISMILAVFMALAFTGFTRSSAQSRGKQNHTKWVADSLQEMETVKVGMTRADVLKVFRGEGGLSTRKWRRYAYRECPYFKVEVEFEPVGEPEKPESVESSKDKITKISRPFLEWSIMD